MNIKIGIPGRRPQMRGNRLAKVKRDCGAAGLAAELGVAAWTCRNQL